MFNEFIEQTVKIFSWCIFAAEKIATYTESNAFALIIEQEILKGAKSFQDFGKNFKKNFPIISPCSHIKPCPLDENLNTWNTCKKFTNVSFCSEQMVPLFVFGKKKNIFSFETGFLKK